MVKTRAEAEHSIKASQGLLEIQFTPIRDDWANLLGESTSPVIDTPATQETGWEEPLPQAEPAYPTAPEPMLPVEAATLTSPANQPEGTEAVLEVEPALSEPANDGVAATQLQNIEINSEFGETIVNILGDGHFFYSTFTLEDPDRYVIDVIGVINNVPLASIGVDDGLITQVRVAQFKTDPELVSRVVVDLERLSLPKIMRRSDGLLLVFTQQPSTTFAEDLSAVMDPPTAEPSVEPSADFIANTPPMLAQPEAPTYPKESVYETRQADLDPVQGDGMGASDIGTAPTAGLPALSPATVADLGSAPSTAANDVDLYGTSSNESTVSTNYDAATESLFDSQTGPTNARTYLGAPMTITVKDADIKDILRSFAEISGLNVVVQPGVRGRVTVELKDVPWDQALEQILKINRLGYQLEGNIMRIAPVSLLQQEAVEQQKLRQAEALAVPLRTVIRRVSYAKASEIASLLKSGGAASVMSRRGTVIVDNRTNTLIIKEIPAFMDVVIAIIETLDTPEPQVLIEARIIETTKRFSRTLGINWGFSGVADPVHGNTTGLIFPNNIRASGAVNLSTGGANGILSLSLGNVLNSFTLDAVLTAAESEGLINVLSAPRVTTLNNQPASIQSGLQIPIQTVANNTVSVQFVNATLRLQVTPHVTAEGTVLM
ncbi:MAG: secretin N-terminal domain-containing protein, partial [Thermoanaerobaculia bacterium]